MLQRKPWAEAPPNRSARPVLPCRPDSARDPGPHLAFGTGAAQGDGGVAAYPVLLTAHAKTMTRPWSTFFICVSPLGFPAYPTMVRVGDEGQWQIDRFSRNEMGGLVIRREGWPGKSAQAGKWSFRLKAATAAADQEYP